jgi:hypothetical protein
LFWRQILLFPPKIKPVAGREYIPAQATPSQKFRPKVQTYKSPLLIFIGVQVQIIIGKEIAERK